MKCELAEITVALTDAPGVMATFTVPSYTRTPDNFRERIAEIQADYIRYSEQTGQGLSVADYGMYLLSVASVKDPREQTESEGGTYPDFGTNPDGSEYNPETY